MRVVGGSSVMIHSVTVSVASRGQRSQNALAHRSVKPVYSARRTSAGSTLAARHAGIVAAPVQTTIRTEAVIAMVRGSSNSPRIKRIELRVLREAMPVLQAQNLR